MIYINRMNVMIKICPVCTVDIPNKSKQWPRQIYCSAKCKKEAFSKEKTRNNRIDQGKAMLVQNEQVIYIIKECKRAKTVQILTGHTLKSFKKTMSFIKDKPHKDIERCHIAPVNGAESIGLLHYKNLFHGGAHQNKLFSNNYYSGGRSINREYLKAEWRVNSFMSNNEILIKVERFLGEIIDKYIADNLVFKSKKMRIIEEIIEWNPKQSKSILIYKTVKYLKSLLGQSICKTSFRKRYSKEDKESKYITYVNEITRLISCSEKRKPLLEELIKIMIIGYMALERTPGSRTKNKYFYVEYESLIDHSYGQAMLKKPDEWPAFKDLIYDAAFNMLQGGSLDINQFRKEVMGYLTFPEEAWKEYALRYYHSGPYI
jgi:predicted nucleic acid-binding Zn ribbon protein